MTLLSNGTKQTRKAGRKAASAGNRTAAPLALPALPARGQWLREEDEPLGDYAYRVLRNTIRAGKIISGEHLREADVAAWLNISRTPVREAFHRLISESLLTNGPWNGAMVANLDVQQLTELYAVRESLEGTAASLAARHATAADMQTMEKMLALEADEHRPEKCVAINRDFHQSIYEAAHNRYLVRALESVVDALGLLHHSTFVLPGSIGQAHREHLQIVSAIRANKSEKAGRLAREHVRHSLKMRLRLHSRRQ